MTSAQTFLITGSESGLGRETAIQLAKAGHRVVGGTLDERRRAEADAAFAEAGVSVETVVLDLTNPDDIAKAVEIPADVLINNAGFGAQGPIVESPLELVRQVFEVNVFGTLALTQGVARRLLAQGARGKIVIISSIAGLFVSKGAGAYTASKFALEAVAEELRLELVPHGFEVNVINPGPFSTGFNERLVGNAPATTLLADDGFAEAYSGLTEGQYDPSIAVDAIVRVASTPGSPYRTIVPAAVGELAKGYQEQVWHDLGDVVAV
ncbi:MAG: SDR family NAD(P)-dependent oxidoreductase [Segniliparus sp.]|uniref:SDR family NAD(P)-dependent oxidoreductase n=1 Tax=Segniliparus sp. TaxID=2804064 RepID=UPI003F3A19F6